MRHTSAVRLLATVLAVVGVPAAAAAQLSAQDTRRPYRALFGGDPNDTTAANLNVSLHGAYDDNVLAEEQKRVDPRFQKSGYLGAASVSLTLQRAGRHVSAGLGLSSGFRYYPDMDEITSVSHGAMGSLSFRLSTRTALRTTAGFAWSPLYRVRLSPVSGLDDDDPGIVDDGSFGDYAVSARAATVALGAAQISHSLTRRVAAQAGYQLRYVDFEEDGRAQRHDSGSAGLSYQVTRYSTLHVSYGYREYRLGTGAYRGDAGDLRVGFDYSRPLSMSGRRTKFSVQPGYTIQARDDGRRELRLAGSATLDHEIGRTWTARVAYRRGVRFMDGLDRDMFGDQVEGGIGGLITRRLEFGLSGGYMGADSGGKSNGYDSYAGSVRLSYALSRHLALFTQYIYFHYRFDEAMVLPPGAPRRLDRQGVRAGVTLWAPLFR